jgi:hypothetical protein
VVLGGDYLLAIFCIFIVNGMEINGNVIGFLHLHSSFVQYQIRFDCVTKMKKTLFPFHRKKERNSNKYFPSPRS